MLSYLFRPLFLFFVVSGIHLFGEDFLDLRHHFQVGDVYAIEQSTIQDRYITINNKESKKQLQTQSFQTLTILQIDEEGNAQAKLTYNDFSFSNTPDGFYPYPKGQNLIIVLKPSGEVIDISGQKSLIQALLEQLPSGEDKEKALKALLSIWSEKNLKKRLSESFCIFPDQRVSLGQSWERSAEIEMGFKIRKLSTTIYTALSPFEIQFTIGSKTGEIEQILNNVPAVYELVSKGKGTIKIDSLGFTTMKNQKILGTLTINNQILPLEAKITSVFKMEKKPSP